MSSVIWNPWHGCTKYSQGCVNCYVYRRDESVGKDASQVVKTKSFDLPVQKKKDGSYRLPAGSHVYACMTSDFFLDKADGWRESAWEMIRERADVDFTIITKRITRFEKCKPDDWKDGYPNVGVVCTVENSAVCDERLSVFNGLSISKKYIACEPLLSDIDLSKYLNPDIISVVCGGESGPCARVCDYNWVLNIREQCIAADVGFFFKQTGARLLKDGRVYKIPRKLQHSQARKAGIDTVKIDLS